MMKKILYTLLLAVLITGNSVAQNKNTARKLFQQGNYAEAKPMFKKLLKKSPQNAEYSYWYAVCCIETQDSADVLPLLEHAASRKISNAFRYMGNYYFERLDYPLAIKNYESFIDLTKDDSLRSQYRTRLADAKRMNRMVMNCEKVCIIDSIVVDKDKLLSAYNIGADAGMVDTQENFFEEEGLDGYLYCSERGTDIIFSDVDNEANSLRKLYSNTSISNEWGRAQRVTGFDTGGNDDYPFMLSDGVTLYFASDGEGSIGGYDLFVTRHNSETGNFLRPDNLGMPFNSTANDYMLAINEVANLGWFASDRNQPEGKVCVYMFIPNVEKERYDESLGFKTLLSRALIESIADTQDNEELLRKAKQQYTILLYSSSTSSRKKDFLFVIDDSRDYYRLSDFESSKAREMFEEWNRRKKVQKNNIALLEQKRDEYAAAAQVQKESMRDSVLELERAVEEEHDALLQLERDIRRVEQDELYK